MTDPVYPQSIKTERGMTDTSLVSERVKTDDSFVDHRKKTESETDRRVQKDRRQADKVRDQTRESTDATTDLMRAGRSKTQENLTHGEMSADNSLSIQRDRDDAAVVFERSLMDAALVRERELNDSEANKFLDRERKETDRNLLRERTHTDSEVTASSELLSKELSSHKATKATLTSRDEFLAIVSHDLRNPLGAILSYADLLLEDTPHSKDEAKKWAEVIKRNAKISLNLISDLLDMERFAKGKLQLKFAPRDINALIQELLESVSILALEREIKLNFRFDEDLPLVDCDRDRVGQILANLISNALKFTPKKGSVTVQTQRFENRVQVRISDTGPGIPADQQIRIFERFTQLENKDRLGLGLGLYISSMLAEAHSGEIKVTSVMGQGSTFTLIVPIKRSF